MALPVLDGNQTATTLSSVVTGGEHIVAHSVVSLGANAIANITSAVSGSVVSVSNFPASQSTTFGAVTGSVSILNFPSTQTIAGTVTANLSSANLNSVTIGVRGSVTLGAGTSQIGSVTVGNTTGLTDAVVAGFGSIFGNSDTFKVDIRTPDGSVLDGEASVPVQGTVDIGSLPAISGTVTAIIGNTVTVGTYNATYQTGSVLAAGSNISIIGGYRTDDSSAFPISVTSQGRIRVFDIQNSVTIGSLPAISGTVTVGNSVNIGSFATSVTARLINPAGTAVTYAEVGTAGSPSIDVLSVQGVSGGTSLPISGTAGSLTTRFGSVTTAGTAQISSAVTNASRRYLLIQNVTTSSNVITVGIGFTPTTTQGIQLSAGAGITFESSYIPTGAVYILSSVTASPFTILEA